MLLLEDLALKIENLSVYGDIQDLILADKMGRDIRKIIVQ
jgi:hypothetical protein